MDENPYTSPSGDLGYQPFRKRFRHALSRAVEAFRKAEGKENIGTVRYILAWLQLLWMLFLCAFIFICVAITGFPSFRLWFW